MKKILILTNISCIFIIAILLYKKYKKNPPVFVKQPCTYQLAEVEHLYKQQIDSSNIIMIGDSRVQQGNWNMLLNQKNIANLGINGDRAYCICNRLKSIENSKAKICFIEGGVMDLYSETPLAILASFTTIVEFCQKQKIVPVINAIVKIADKASPYYKLANQKIDTVNQYLAEYAKKMEIDYIDLNPEFIIPSSNTLSDKFSVDGSHFNDTAYKLWSNKIITVLKKHNIN